ncbi:hypothetical protein Cgig2_006354 [Carnegiea gigantea]|uniref:Ubiquitin-like protease family profile domain-containing protein n=1 Tax=Carnegiea gigantea TaxID=171969 RepID=A0A9Q1JPL9_9CARY|nr:hypothetical protein Cgig2_006354 [Carnegiea gigantea]
MDTGCNDSRRTPSNIVTRLKKVLRLRKASTFQGSLYTNPIRGRKGGRRIQKSSTMFKRAIAGGSGANLEGEVVNDDQFVSVMPIAVALADEEIVEGTVSEAGPKEDVRPPCSSIPSSTMKAALTCGKRSTSVISDDVRFSKSVRAYLTWTLLADEANLLSVIRSRCKGLKDGQWNFDLLEATDKYVNVEFLKGLINVVPTRGVRDRPSRYCIGAFVVHIYSKLLDQWQQQYKRYYCNSVFLDWYDHVFMPLFDSVAEQWLVLVGDLKKRRFLKVAVSLALMKVAEFTDVLKWDLEHPNCPPQENGRDCGVYMSMFMDLLSMNTDGLVFGAQYVRRARDKLLLSFLLGRVAHFPNALQGT